ncbi:hypothetical protein RclHR1_07350010 [Rhizophagus clarus]|uniref:Uncharacterized protein n=1 Tax=Rhizophagus clarus TaxID=94130 RepID=A0A2Z6SKU0_9GLOM|nr:hypothetical protein RclHR1_07350010 [Rhizophagus clarus]GET01778.1 hypothetical protein GLOIN_2v1652895 [Rhizophagus clarus]
MEPDKLSECNVRPLLNPNKFNLLNNIKNRFLDKFEKKIPFSCVIERLVDNKEVIVAFIDQPEGMSIHLPAKFEGIPILISYKALVLHHYL